MCIEYMLFGHDEKKNEQSSGQYTIIRFIWLRHNNIKYNEDKQSIHIFIDLQFYIEINIKVYKTEERTQINMVILRTR